jgi:hypothetical protein
MRSAKSHETARKTVFRDISCDFVDRLDAFLLERSLYTIQAKTSLLTAN